MKSALNISMKSDQAPTAACDASPPASTIQAIGNHVYCVLAVAIMGLTCSLQQAAAQGIVRFYGVSNQPMGVATLDLKDGGLDISNIGGTGGDGVRLLVE